MRRHLSTRLLLALTLSAPLSACKGPGFDGPMRFGDRVVEVATLERGQSLYNRYCATCHGYSGEADTPQARQLDPRPRDLSAGEFKRVSEPGALPSDQALGDIIRNGIPGTGMPPWPQLEGSELDAVIQYLKTFSPRWQTQPSAAPQTPPRGSMKALPAGTSTASFRAADDLVALAQGMGTTDAASHRHPPTPGHSQHHANGLRLRAERPEDFADTGLAPNLTDLNPRTAR